MELKKQVEEVWEKYNTYKKTAEQHEFPLLFLYDMKIEPAYKDLQKNWSDEHAEIFVRAIKNTVFKKLNIAN